MKKVIIIGAGPAGLTAGYELLKDNNGEYEVIILEADNRIGGISKTVNVDGNRMDLGGHRFFSKDEEVMNFWKELMPLQGENSFDDKKIKRKKPLVVGGPNPETDDKVMLIRDRVSRIYYLKKFFDVFMPRVSACPYGLRCNPRGISVRLSSLSCNPLL